MKNIFSSLLILLFLADVVAQGQVRVTKGAGQKSSIDLSGLAAGDQPAQILKHALEGDLIRSGWFSKAAAWQGEFAVTGAGRTDGTTLRG